MESGTLSHDMLGQLRRSAGRLSICGALETMHIASLAGLVPGEFPRGVIFTLHQVSDEPRRDFSPNAHLSITPAFLEVAIKTILSLGYTPVPLDQMPERFSEEDDGTRYAAFTLDDGYRDNLTEAYPVFRKYDVPFTIFVTQGFVRRTRSIWWKTLEELLRGNARIDSPLPGESRTLNADSTLRKYASFKRICAELDRIEEDEFVERVDACAQSNGLDPMAIVDREIMNEEELQSLCSDGLASLGAHTVNHNNLARVDLERTRDEMLRSADFVHSLTGKQVTTFAYPYGGRTAACNREFSAARDCGFELAVTTRPGLLDTMDADNLFGLPRLSLNGHYQKARYVRALLTGMPLKLASTLRIQG